MAPYCLAKPLFLCPLRSPESTKLKPAKRAASNASKEAGNSPITSAPRENFQLDKKLLKLKSRVSFRSALSQSFEGLAGSQIDHKFWWSTNWYVRRSAARSRLCPRIHVFGNASCTETVTTNLFQDPAGLLAVTSTVGLKRVV
jgi:hypothetical protein